MKKISIGILAHVDAGKTTLSEAMLYTSGATRKLGRVDHKDAFLDTHTLERSRGITIFSKQAVMKIGDDEITLLDTPGHVDFSAEAERVLQVLDYAILLISGTDGVQSHTETLWYLLKSYHIPVFIFVNKMDISGIGKELLMAELERRLDGGCIDFSGAEGGIFTEEQAEAVSLRDEAIMSEYLENSVISAETVIKAINKRKIFPCFFGSALKMKGIDTFLNGLGFYTKEKQYGEEFAASVFKITEGDFSFLILGDLGTAASDRLMASGKDITATAVQLSHHGQGGSPERLYKAINPKFAFWPTPEWLWNNEAYLGDGKPDTGPFTSRQTRKWMETLGVINITSFTHTTAFDTKTLENTDY